jgi:hypothetical protein
VFVAGERQLPEGLPDDFARAMRQAMRELWS